MIHQFLASSIYHHLHVEILISFWPRCLPYLLVLYHYMIFIFREWPTIILWCQEGLFQGFHKFEFVALSKFNSHPLLSFTSDNYNNILFFMLIFCLTKVMLSFSNSTHEFWSHFLLFIFLGRLVLNFQFLDLDNLRTLASRIWMSYFLAIYPYFYTNFRCQIFQSKVKFICLPLGSIFCFFEVLFYL